MHYRSAVFYSQRLVGTKEAAEDIVHNVFVKLMSEDLYISGALESYLYAAVHNKSIDLLRSNRSADPGDMLDGLYMIEDHDEPDNDEFHRTLRIRNMYEAIEKLPEKARRIFKMIQLEGMSYQETADTLGISLNTVRTQMYRSMRFLKNTLG